MDTMLQYILFFIENHPYVLPLSAVEQVIRAVEITPLPQSLPTVQGIIDLHGQIVPVLNIRRRLGLPARELRLDDHLMVVQTSRRTIAFVVDEVRGIIELPVKQLIAGGEIFAGITHLDGGIRTEHGLIFIHNPEQLFSFEDEVLSAEALKKGGIQL